LVVFNGRVVAVSILDVSTVSAEVAEDCSLLFALSLHPTIALAINANKAIAKNVGFGLRRIM
jgi:hypothetical protein